MAVTTISGPDTAQVALSTSYLGASDDIRISNCDTVEVWIEGAAIAGTIKLTATNSNVEASPEVTLAAGNHWTFTIGDGAEMTLDAKSASGTPNLGLVSGMFARD